MKIALVHDWLVGVRGGERVLDAILEALVNEGHQIVGHTLIKGPLTGLPRLESIEWKTSPLQNLPNIRSWYRHSLPAMPWAIGQFDVSGFDAIVSSSHCVAKGIPNPRALPHWSYIHAPMRYVWDRFEDYFGQDRQGFWTRAAANALRPRLQSWDRASATPNRVSHLVANSHFIASQVERHYGRNAEVIHPFVDLERFHPRAQRDGEFYLMVGAFAPNKRVDLAIEAARQAKFPLWIVGEGQDRERLEQVAAGSAVRFLGARSDQEISELYANCRAFLFPGVEDFGITPLEAMASGAPVIAFRAGGVLDSATDETGVFFAEQSVSAFVAAVREFERRAPEFEPPKLRRRAEEFSRRKFLKEVTISLRKSLII